VLPAYLADVARELRERSASIRRGFLAHNPSIGAGREELVEQFLKEHLPARLGVSTGLVFSHDGLFSNQADLLVVDKLHNAPLYGSMRNQLWPVEGVYALIEVKSGLNPSDIADAVSKGRRFKLLQRRFCEGPVFQRTMESLFVIWAFDSPDPATVKVNLLKALREIPRSEQPDLLIVPHRLVAKGGVYLETARLGLAGSERRRQLEAQYGTDLSSLMPNAVEVDNLGENSLLAWYVWFDSWLRQAGGRLADPARYLPLDGVFGFRE
jgi:hypothetical protein